MAFNGALAVWSRKNDTSPGIDERVKNSSNHLLCHLFQHVYSKSYRLVKYRKKSEESIKAPRDSVDVLRKYCEFRL